MLTPDFVAKKWPVFEMFMLEARIADDHQSSSFRLLHDVCSPPDSVRWASLGWPRNADGTATVWLDVLQRLPFSLRKSSSRVVVELQSDKFDARARHVNELIDVVVDQLAALNVVSAPSQPPRLIEPTSSDVPPQQHQPQQHAATSLSLRAPRSHNSRNVKRRAFSNCLCVFGVVVVWKMLRVVCRSQLDYDCSFCRWRCDCTTIDRFVCGNCHCYDCVSFTNSQNNCRSCS